MVGGFALFSYVIGNIQQIVNEIDSESVYLE